MASMQGWPTDGDNGSVATEARWRSMARLWAPSGVVTGLAPTLAAGPIVNVTAGAAWVDGHYTELGSPAAESATANGLLVVRFTAASNLFELVYRDGITTPTQSDAVWELPIAQMVTGALTDLRVFTAPTGTATRVTALPATLAVPSWVNTVTVTGRVYVAGTTISVPDQLVARFNGVTSSTYYRVAETVGDSAAFVRNFAGADAARLGPVPYNSTSNSLIDVTLDAASGAWISQGIAVRSATVWQEDRNTGGILPVRVTSLNLFISSPSGAVTAALAVTYT